MAWFGIGATCSCGCGRRVASGDRRMNARARTARQLVGEMERLGFETDKDEYRRAFLFEGVSWRNQYTRIVHGELTREETRGDGPWEAWRSGTRSALREARRSR